MKRIKHIYLICPVDIFLKICRVSFSHVFSATPFICLEFHFQHFLLVCLKISPSHFEVVLVLLQDLSCQNLSYLSCSWHGIFKRFYALSQNFTYFLGKSSQSCKISGETIKLKSFWPYLVQVTLEALINCYI